MPLSAPFGDGAPLSDRVVEVIADRGKGAAKARYEYGSGCIVRGRTVLTAAHVVADAEQVLIRLPDKTSLSAVIDLEFIGNRAGPDLALVDIDDETIDLPAMELAGVDRKSLVDKPVEGCHAVGYPWFAENPELGKMRDTVDAWGHVPVNEGLVSGLLTVQVTSSPDATALAESVWSGMSGAPVVVDGCLIGVVIEHAPRKGPSAITAAPLSALDFDPEHPKWGPGVSNAAEWWSRLGASALARLRLFPSPEEPPAYWAKVREIHWATPQLFHRSAELADLVTFATGSRGYRWLVGDAWAGKTSLVAEAVTTILPSWANVVAYFASRTRTDADSDGFLAAVVPQLAYLLQKNPPAPTVAEFLALWHAAAERAAKKKRHLLLVVDGLDEDLRPKGAPSIASVLPTEAGGYAHVLVTSRDVRLPLDIPARHPLRDIDRTILTPSEEAKKIAILAEQEIDGLLQRGQDPASVLGVLAAAGGALAIHDLAALTADPSGLDFAARLGKIRRIVTEEAARSLLPVGTAGPMRYRFRHVSLLEQAQKQQSESAGTYRRQIEGWADRWRDAGWPTPAGQDETTPRYLLDEYPATLLDQAERLAALVSNLGWVNAAVQTVGVDGVLTALAKAETAARGHAASGEDPDAVRLLRRAIGRSRPLLSPTVPASAQTATLASRLEAIPGLEPRVQAWARALPGPRLENLLALPDEDPALSHRLEGHRDWVRSCAFTPDGKLLASVDDDGWVSIWEADSGHQRSEFIGHPAEVTACSFAPAGTVLATGGVDGTLRLWRSPGEGATDWQRTDLAGHRGWVRSCTFSADGTRLATASDDYTARVWPVTAGRKKTGPLATLRHAASVRACAFLPGSDAGRLATATEDGKVWIWNLADVAEPPRLVLEGRTGIGSACAFFGDGELVMVSDADGTLGIWNLAEVTEVTEPPRLRLRGLTGLATTCVFSPDGGLAAAAGRDHAIRVWKVDVDGPEPEVSAVYRGPTAQVRTCAFSPDPALPADFVLLAAGGDDRMVRIWEGASSEQAVMQHTDWVRCCAFSPDGTLVATASDDRTARIWDAQSGQRRWVLEGHEDWVRCCAFSPDGTLVVTASDDKTARIWDVATGEQRRVLEGHEDWVRFCAFSPDGTLVGTASDDKTARIWDAATGQQRATAEDHQSWVSACVFSANGRSLITGGFDGIVCLYDTASGQLQYALTGHTGPVLACALSPDGAQLATASADRTVRLWQLRTRQVRAVLSHPDWVRGCAFSPDGTQLATAGDDGMLRVWNIADAEPVCVAGLRVAHVLSDCDWQPAGQPGNLIYACGQAGMYGFRLRP